MRSAIASRARSLSALLLGLVGAGCASFVEVPVETPLQSKLDVSSFRRVLVAGFVSEPGEAEIARNAASRSAKLRVLLRGGRA